MREQHHVSYSEREREARAHGESNRKHRKLKGNGLGEVSVNPSVRFDSVEFVYRLLTREWQAKQACLRTLSCHSHAVLSKLLCRHRVLAVCGRHEPGDVCAFSVFVDAILNTLHRSADTLFNVGSV